VRGSIASQLATASVGAAYLLGLGAVPQEKQVVTPINVRIAARPESWPAIRRIEELVVRTGVLHLDASVYQDVQRYIAATVPSRWQATERLTNPAVDSRNESQPGSRIASVHCGWWVWDGLLVLVPVGPTGTAA
jgi:hypothetical protein